MSENNQIEVTEKEKQEETSVPVEVLLNMSKEELAKQKDVTILMKEELEALIETADGELEKNPEYIRMKEIQEGKVDHNKPMEIKLNESTELNEIEMKELFDAPNGKIPKKFSTGRSLAQAAAGEVGYSDMLALNNILHKCSIDPNFDIAAALPESIKNYVFTLARSYNITSRKSINSFIKMTIESMVADYKFDQEMNMTDFESCMSQLSNFTDVIGETIRDRFEKDIVVAAQDALLRGNNTLHDKLMEISKAYTDSYTLVRQRELLSNELFMRSLNKKISDKHFFRACEDYNFKLSKSRFTSAKIEILVIGLMKVFEVTEPTARKYAALLMHVTKDYSYTDDAKMWFMHSSIKNIQAMGTGLHSQSEFARLIANNIKSLMEDIINTEERVLSV